MIAAAAALTLTGRHVLLALFCLLVGASVASADCAWVLWLNQTGVLAGEELDIWTPLNTSTNKPDC